MESKSMQSQLFQRVQRIVSMPCLATVNEVSIKKNFELTSMQHIDRDWSFQALLSLAHDVGA